MKAAGGETEWHTTIVIAPRVFHSREINTKFRTFLASPWNQGALLVLLLAAGLRVWDLGLKPAHFDEGINGMFIDRMASEGCYVYDPSNYHGPLYFYLLFVMQTLFGRSIEVLRMVSVLAGAGVVATVVWGYRRHFGRGVCLGWGALMAVSPALVFVSRYAIHEMVLLLFLLLLILGLLDRWRGRSGAWLICLGAAGMVLTKETYLLHAICLLLAWVTARLLARFSPDVPEAPMDGANRPGGGRDLWLPGLAGVMAVLFFYSGNFLAPGGVKGLWQTFAVWSQTGIGASGHEKPWYYWLKLMSHYEWAGLAGFIAGIRFVFPSRRSIRFVVIAGTGTLVAYSIIPYKTPWCIVMLLGPGLLSLAWVLGEFSRRSRRGKIVAGLLGVLLAGHALWMTCRLNWSRYDELTEPYVYVQTSRVADRFLGPLRQAARADDGRLRVPGMIVMNMSYPLPWVLADFPRLSYLEKHQPVDGRIKQAYFLLVTNSRRAEIEKAMHGRYFVRSLILWDPRDPLTAYFKEPFFAPYMNKDEVAWMIGGPDAAGTGEQGKAGAP